MEPRGVLDVPCDVIIFAEDFTESVSEGVMVDVSSSGIASSCGADENCPHPGQRLTTRFNVPPFGKENRSDMKSITRTGRVCRVDSISNVRCNVAIQFDEPPPFWDKPPAVK